MHSKITHLLVTVFLLTTYFQSDAQYVWRHRACLPAAARRGAVPFVVGNKFYIVGGCPTSNIDAIFEVWQYDPATDLWTQKNNYPANEYCPVAFVINDTAYVGLGNPYYGGIGQYSVSFYRYNQQSDTWTSITDFPGVPRYDAMTFTINGEGYVGCGHGAGQNNDFWQYDPPTNTWTQEANFPGLPRQDGFGAATSTTGYMGLGFGDGPTIYEDVYSYNPSSNSWTPVADYGPEQRTSVAVFVINDTFYLAGGCSVLGSTSPADYFADCWIYDSSNNTWNQENGFTCVGSPRGIYKGFNIGGHGYFYGGGDYLGDVFNDLLEFGPPDTAFIERVYVLGDDTSYCSGFSRLLSVSDSCALWSTGYIGPQITVDTAGIYWVTFNDSCGISTDTISITESSLPISVSIQNVGCGSMDGSVTIYPIGGQPPYTYLWNIGDSTAGISNLDAGTYDVTVSDAAGCSATLSAIVTSSGSDTVSIASSQTTICSNDSAHICATTGFENYIWNNGETGQCIYTNLAGNYYVTASGPGNCSAISNHFSLYVLPVPPIEISISGDTLTCYNGLSIQWYYNNDSIPGATSNVLIATQPGLYSVVILDSNGCSAMSNEVVIPTGINDLPENSVKVYPNPLENGNWMIQSDQNIIGATAEIFDENGQLVYRQEITSSSWPIDLNMASGVYLLRILSADKYFIQKLVKL